MNLYYILLQANHVDKVVNTAFEIDPTKIYSWALGALVVLVLLFATVILYLFRYFENKIEDIQETHNKRVEKLETINENKNNVIIALKEKSLGVYKDVAQALQLLEIASKDGSDDIRKEITNLHQDINNQLHSLEKMLLVDGKKQ